MSAIDTRRGIGVNNRLRPFEKKITGRHARTEIRGVRRTGGQGEKKNVSEALADTGE